MLYLYRGKGNPPNKEGKTMASIEFINKRIAGKKAEIEKLEKKME